MWKRLALAVVLAAAPTALSARGTPPAPQHGGIVVGDTTEHWVELVLNGDQLALYVLDESLRPVSSTKLAGKAIIVIGGTAQPVALSPGEGNSLTGRLKGPASGHFTAELDLSVAGNLSHADFTSPP